MKCNLKTNMRLNSEDPVENQDPNQSKKHQRLMGKKAEDPRRKKWYKTYYSIRYRCTSKKFPYYHRYGGRGIKCLITQEDIKKLWIRDKADKLKFPSIDRIDNDGDYIYSNCRYIELSENAKKNKFSLKKFCPRGHPYKGKNLYINRSEGWNNRICQACCRMHRTKYIFNLKLTVCGQTKTLAEWGEKTGLKPNTIFSRINRGRPTHRLLCPKYKNYLKIYETKPNQHHRNSRMDQPLLVHHSEV